jgi:hypothetical protein
MVWGAERFHTAFSALSRSLWWYNRDLVRSSSFPSPTPVAVPTREGEQGKRNQHPE